MIEFLLVFVLTILAGAWSTAAGVMLGLDPFAVWVAATLGSITFSLFVLYFVGTWRDQLVERYSLDRERSISESPAGTLIESWGIPGLAIGSLLIGPSLTLGAVLVLGIDRPRFLLWYIPVTVVGFGLATLFWVVAGV